MHADGDWQAVEGVLTKDMATVGEYLWIWKLQPSITKTVSPVFHLNNKDAKYELKINQNNKTLSFWPNPNTSEERWTGRSRIADISSHFAKS